MDLYKVFSEHPVITTDSRNCPEGALFFALRGESFDGNEYAVSAIEKGCAYAVIDDVRVFEGAKATGMARRLILVPDVLTSLQDLARTHRRHWGKTIIGVTGTNGKTTTKELIAAVLGKKYDVLFTQGNFNNHIGVPKTLLQLSGSHDIAVVEMGANHPGEIKTLVNITEPEYGVITNVGKAHLLGFGSLEGVIRTKGELYDYLREHHGTAFVNENDEHLMNICHGLNVIKYGDNGRFIASDPFLAFSYEGQQVRTRLIGGYNLDNCLCAAAIGRQFGVSDEDIVAALSEYTPTNNRSMLRKTERNDLIIDAYNANPTSMAAALSNFRQLKAKGKMCILGAMRELGEASEEEHRKVIATLEDMDIEDVMLVGEEWDEVVTGASARFSLFKDINALSEYLTENPLCGHTILVKGSNSTRLIQSIELL
ncbi:MAG: UDP-N-acetylmuramoyl-tripeptide--D-alanyl-D-alanine ligase [Bacteroidaceae bacterium]|nr:UDP-N-acetylmuramoyl-tripeptide--D-alanyl-D-alanine ligase [Bacteroidaceae bacterium]